jgi:hypothetical protein
MRRGIAILFSALMTVGCTSTPDAAAPASTAGPESAAGAAPAASGAPAPAASLGPGGCGATPVRSGALPGWTASANPPAIPWVMSREGNLVGAVFGYPLKAPAVQTAPQNKILWIVQEPRNDGDLVLTLRPVGGGDAVTVSEPAGSSPGEIYPSIVDVPAPGCWEMVAEWDGHRATLGLSYQPRGAG